MEKGSWRSAGMGAAASGATVPVNCTGVLPAMAAGLAAVLPGNAEAEPPGFAPAPLASRAAIRAGLAVVLAGTATAARAGLTVVPSAWPSWRPNRGVGGALLVVGLSGGEKMTAARACGGGEHGGRGGTGIAASACTCARHRCSAAHQPPTHPCIRCFPVLKLTPAPTISPRPPSQGAPTARRRRQRRLAGPGGAGEGWEGRCAAPPAPSLPLHPDGPACV